MKVFIDGSAGTTGLRIAERLALRQDISLIRLPEERRKDIEARRECLNAADIVFLCLPDDAAVEAVSLIENPAVAVIDTSTAHRTAEGWTYGFAELEGQREKIAASKRIANPGCHASGFIALAAPLVRAGLIPADRYLSCFSLTGYSGGGKKMIADYDNGRGRSPAPPDGVDSLLLLGGRQYALGQSHKHLPEMVKVCGLAHAPCFSPVVVPHYSGMEVTVPLFDRDVAAIRKCYAEYYGVAGRETGDAGRGLVAFAEDPAAAEGGFLSSAALSGRDDMEVSVYGGGERILLVARFDNLGKGASGAAIQNMNIVLGVAEDEGLARGR